MSLSLRWGGGLVRALLESDAIVQLRREGARIRRLEELNARYGSTVPDPANPSTHRFELVGRLAELPLPGLCASCGADAESTLAIQKAFRRLEGEDWVHVVDEIDVPFCTGCVAQHEREDALLPPLPELKPPHVTEHLLPALLVAFGLLIIARIAVGLADRSPFGAALAAVVGGSFVLVGFLAAKGARRVPAHEQVRLPTSVSACFDFTTELNDQFEPPRREYILDNPEFANAFRQLNTGRTWDPHGPEAKRARRKWIVAAVTMLALLLAGMMFSVV